MKYKKFKRSKNAKSMDNSITLRIETIRSLKMHFFLYLSDT